MIQGRGSGARRASAQDALSATPGAAHNDLKAAQSSSFLFAPLAQIRWLIETKFPLLKYCKR
jgi:hypothetical protein